MEKIKSFVKTTKELVIISIIISLAIGFFAGMEYKAYQIRSAFQKATKTFQEELAKTPTLGEVLKKEELEGQKMNIIEKRVGDEVELATIKFKVNSIEEKQTLTTKYGSPTVAKENAKFVVINMDVTNITDKPFDFYVGDISVIDNKDREFLPYERTIGSVDNYLNMRRLSPGIKENGVLVYELPKDATSYSLVIGKAGTNEIYKVLLETTKAEKETQSTEQQKTESMESSTSPAPKIWREVKTFTGTGTDTNMEQNTDSFTIRGEKWRVKWRFQDSSPFASVKGTFAIFAYKTDGTPYETLLNVSGSGEGISYAFGSGKFYLRVLTTGGSWNLIVEEYR
jgi:hypothetical protein